MQTAVHDDRPLLFDTFCGGGGCSVGYDRAGFRVVGCDNRPQRHYPFDFVQADALGLLRRLIDGETVTFASEQAYKLNDFAVIHASPPCQGYSKTQRIWGREYPKLIEVARDLLQATGKAYVIENVPDAPMPNALMLCGTMFDLKVYRHRLFESNVFMLAPCHGWHPEKVVATGKPVAEGQYMTVAGHFANPAYARRVMGIGWMSRDELAQAIPPAYTKWVGTQLLAHLEAKHAKLSA